MPANFIIDVQHRLVFSTGDGVFTHADFLEHMARLQRDARFQPEFDQLVDCRAFTLQLTSEEISDLASRSVFSSRSRRAFVVASSLQFGLSRMFAAYREEKGRQETMVFRDLREALAWLNLPPDWKPTAVDSTPSA
jgi:hypothetical protein